MKTSYFDRYKGENGVSIAGAPPAGYKGRQYKKLALKYWFFKKYKEDGDEEFYVEQFYKEVLDKLDPQQVYNELGEDAVLLCFEKPGKFCHRHIVAKWLSEKLGIVIEEYQCK